MNLFIGVKVSSKKINDDDQNHNKTRGDRVGFKHNFSLRKGIKKGFPFGEAFERK